MAFDVDLLIDRRRLKRKLAFWRVAAVVAFVAAVLAAVGTFQDHWGGPYIARLTVDGVITDDRERDSVLDALTKESAAKALIVRIDSPGGTVVGGEALFGRLRAVAAHMPVVAVMGELGTSAAYMTAAACDLIVAHEGTITGSIGVILQTA
ncbi:MAG TPA: S49 family peptidase, partial [Candidatus Defluviicoccus seviourii]|nr:S49 family peptidase [Candidatus Defluviicoccus seviourii]